MSSSKHSSMAQTPSSPSSFELMERPHSINDALRTPHKASGSNVMTTSSINSTPHNLGLTDHITHEQKHTRKDYHPFLAHDLAGTKEVAVELFLSKALHMASVTADEQTALQSIIDSTEFDSLIDTYCSETTKEQDRYPRFVNLVNYAVDKMVEHKITPNSLDFKVCVNDPRNIYGSYSIRSPDTLGVKKAAVKSRLEKGKDMNEALQSPPSQRYRWSDVLTFMEFKRSLRQISRDGQTSSVEKASKGKAKADVSKASKGKAKAGPSSLGSSKTTSSRKVKADVLKGIAKAEPSSLGSAQTSSRKVKADVRKASKGKAKAEPSSLGSSQIRHTPRSNSRISASGSTSAVKTQSVIKRSAPESLASDETSSNPLKRTFDESGLTGSSEQRAKRLREDENDCYLQCASYALEMFNRGGIRTHVVGALVKDDILELLLYTRSGTLRSASFSFVRDPSMFLRVILAFTRLTPSQWGHFDRLEPITSVPPTHHVALRRAKGMFEGQVLHLENLDLTVDKILVYPRGLIGRGTWVLRGRSNRWSGDSVVIKISFPAENRTSELLFIETATKYAKQDGHEWVLDHLPHLLHSEDVALESTSFSSIFGADFEKRVMRVLVFEELRPITQLADAASFGKAWVDTVKCYEWLVTYPKILHRDISVNNLMYRKKKDGTICGVLNDYDLARDLTLKNPHPSSKQRTGTKPFVAVELLKATSQPITHRVRHDLESFFYVFTWVICRYHNGAEIANPPFESWAEGTWEAVAKEKKDFLGEPLPKVTENYASLIPILHTLQQAYHDAFYSHEKYRAQKAYQLMLSNVETNESTFDEDTLGGNITFTKYSQVSAKFPPYHVHQSVNAH